jgi:branched-chain amino acid transport system permease protein
MVPPPRLWANTNGTARALSECAVQHAQMNAATLLQVISSGIVTGCIYALVALSLLIVFKSTEIVNFGGGDVLMFGAYVALLCIDHFGLGYGATLLVTSGTMFLVGAAFEVAVLRQVRGKLSPNRVLVSLVIATIGLAYALRGTVRLFSYTDDVRRLPVVLHGPPLFLGPIVVQRQDIVIMATTALMVLALFAFFHFTWLGKALRAASVNPRAAELVGIKIARMHVLSWGVACVTAGVGGILVGGKIPMTPDLGTQVAFLAFAAATIGGFKSLPGCIIGGILLGEVQNIVGFFISSASIAVAPFIVIMLVLVLMPQGLFGGAAAVKKV